jgi:leader peptidase (prepilin peptidase)/N-methyltransferase
MTPLDWLFLAALVLILVAISAVDIATMRIPNVLNLTLGLLGLTRALYRAPNLGTVIGELAAVFLTFTVLLGTAWLVRRVIGRDDIGRADIGRGDIKFLIAASCWVGVEGSMITFVIAGCVTVFGALALHPWYRIDVRRTVPFGPMLALGLLLVTLGVHV